MFRKIMIAVLLFGAAGAAVGAGTFASFSASTTNQTSTFASGTLELSNQKNNATACLSYGTSVDTNENTTCDALFGANTSITQLPFTPTPVFVTLDSTGSIEGTTLSYQVPSCSNTAAAGASHSGNGNLCASMQVYIQEVTSAPTFDGNGALSNNPAGNGKCIFPANANANCSTTFADANNSVQNLVTAASGGVNLSPAALTTARYFKIGVQVPDLGNSLQGRAAGFAVKWSIV